MKPLLKKAFYAAGGLALLRCYNTAHPRILMYHNFASASAAGFEAQCAHIRRFYNPVTLEEIDAFAREQKPAPPNAIAITVDDGYRDFYLNAYPILQRHRIPATVFLMTDFLDGKTWPWWDQLRMAIARSPLKSVAIAIGDLPEQHYSLSDEQARGAAYHSIAEALKAVPNRQRLKCIENLSGAFAVEAPRKPPPGLEPMTWFEAREMAANGIAFGGHTMSHPILSKLESEDLMTAEIQGCRTRIAAEIGTPPLHFCYPNGRPEDIGPAVRQIVERSGFHTAVSCDSGLIRAGADPYTLRRIAMEPEVSKAEFGRQIAGFRLSA